MIGDSRLARAIPQDWMKGIDYANWPERFP
jgi:hypothetical protein